MMNNLRSLERKLGVFEIVKRNNGDRIILVDEGTVLSAHHVFVFTDASYTPDEISQFASLIPLPDVIVYIRAPLECLIERSLHRTDPPRIMRSKNRAQNEVYIRRAVKMFEQLVKTEQIQKRVLVIENPDSSKLEWNQTVHKITQSILNYDPAEMVQDN
jgi:thymidylate kinase